jgi:hypothetical protein
MVHTKSVPLGAQEMHFETGRMAKASNGACVVRLGDAMVLAALAEGKPRGGILILARYLKFHSVLSFSKLSSSNSVNISL